MLQHLSQSDQAKLPSHRSKKNYTPGQESKHILVDTLTEDEDQSTGYIGVPPSISYTAQKILQTLQASV